MPTRSLVDPLQASDAGGVASRRGFRYQDHVGAGLLLDMIEERNLSQVEFETGDDLTLIWNLNSSKCIEYVQVKTTDKDTKWNLKELKTRTKAKGTTNKTSPGSSIMEKSLMCDKFTHPVLFRLITTRDTSKNLKLFTVARNKREPINEQFKKLVQSFNNVYKTSKSQNGLTIIDWAEKLLWQIESSIESLRTKNINRIARLGENEGTVPNVTTTDEIYKSLLNLVMDAADASRELDPDLKSITRSEILEWWRSQIGTIQAKNNSTLKVYKINLPKFFSELHSKSDEEVKRSLHSYDAEYDLNEWRGDQLVDYAFDWLPELVLPASILANFSHLDALKLTKDALLKFESNSSTIKDNELLGELIIHSILRYFFKSEPIACKIFGSNGRKVFSRCAHIIPGDNGDELWLGRAHVATTRNYKVILQDILNEMNFSVGREFLESERNLIIQLREPRHMRDTSLATALCSSGKLQDILHALRIPILIAYDSKILAKGYADDYLESLIDEVESTYEDLKSAFPVTFQEIRINLFLIPVENAGTLVKKFSKKIR